MASKWYIKHKEELLSRLKDRYKDDKEFRAKARETYRERYHTDTEYRDKTLQRAKDRYHTDEKYRQATIERSRRRRKKPDTSRLHNLLITLDGMTPDEYKNSGINLTINYSFAESPFGNLIVASTNKGICYMAFVEVSKSALIDLHLQFPNATFHQQADKFQQSALFIFQNDWSKLNEIKIHLKGTAFQLKVWEALLSVPYGSLSTYGAIANLIDSPKASRAVGTAIGNNPVAYLIPCHRVIQQSGNIGGYRWGSIRKKAIISWEASTLKQRATYS